MKPITKNTLFYGDNLFILHEHIPNESVDLIYLDPPFNSIRNYNVLFKDEHGTDSEVRKVRRKQGTSYSTYRTPGES
jgi:site-specific DNA-methyltransferase (adenine-specific)